MYYNDVILELRQINRTLGDVLSEIQRQNKAQIYDVKFADSTISVDEIANKLAYYIAENKTSYFSDQY